MKKVWSILILFILSLVFLTACGEDDSTSSVSASDSSDNAKKENDDWPETIRFAVTGIEGLEELQRQYGAFQDLMERLLDVEVEFFALSNRTIAATAMEYDQVDIILSGPSEYAQTKSAEPGAEPLAAIERAAYYTVFIVAEDSEFQTLEDLKGHSIAMKEAGSTSGHIGPSALLIENGIDIHRDVDIKLLDGARVDALKSGEVDALADGIRVYDKLVEEDGEGVWRILVEGPPLPQDPFVASPKLPESFKAEFKRVLLEHEEEFLEAILSHEENEKYREAKIVDIDDSDYDLMRETYKTLGIDL